MSQIKTSTSDDCLPENDFSDDNLNDDDLTNDKTEMCEEYDLKGGLKLVTRQKLQTDLQQTETTFAQFLTQICG